MVHWLCSCDRLSDSTMPDGHHNTCAHNLHLPAPPVSRARAGAGGWRAPVLRTVYRRPRRAQDGVGAGWREQQHPPQSAQRPPPSRPSRKAALGSVRSTASWGSTCSPGGEGTVPSKRASIASRPVNSRAIRAFRASIATSASPRKRDGTGAHLDSGVLVLATLGRLARRWSPPMLDTAGKCESSSRPPEARRRRHAHCRWRGRSKQDERRPALHQSKPGELS